MIDQARVLIVGCGAVGAQVARRLRGDGHHVTGTTTRQERRVQIEESCDAALVVSGGDREAVAAAVADADVVVVCVSPPEGRSTTVEGRLEVYRSSLVQTAASISAAADHRPVVAISSLSVFGAALGAGVLTEDAALPDLRDPSPCAYREMEERYLADLAGQVTILRTGDIVSLGDPSLEQKVAMAHKYLAGSVPFDDRALAYRVTAEEIATVVLGVLAAGPQGVLHVVPQEVPPTNGELYGAACAAAGLAPLAFRRELATPTVPVSAGRLADLGMHLIGPA